MRLPLTKPWRAYPELDRYSDTQCRAIMNQAHRAFQLWRTIFAVCAILLSVIGFFCCMFACVSFAGMLDKTFRERHVLKLTGLALILSSLIPIILVMFGSRLVTSRALRAHLGALKCFACRYLLIGLRIESTDARNPGVACPECGSFNPLLDMGIQAQLTETGVLADPDTDPDRA